MQVNNGFIEVIDSLGTDSTVVNAARVSFGKKITELEEKDIKLLEYLAKNNHTSPFRHCSVQFHIKAPEFVARQFWKHCVGADYTFKDTAWNELSGRYVTYSPESWIPSTLRQQSVDKKQGSSIQPIANQDYFIEMYKNANQAAYDVYEAMLKAGVCREQARTILPINIYTEWYWTASLQAIHHFVKLRNESHAQEEIQEYARVMNDLMKDLFPNAWKSLNEV